MSLKTNVFYNMLLSVLNMLFPMITAPYISRVLGVENVGLINFSMSYVSYYVLFAALGVSTYGMREIAKFKHDPDKTSQVFSEIFRLTILSTIPVSLVYCGSVFFVSSLRHNLAVFMIVGILLYLTPITIDWYFQGLEDFRMITLRSFVVKAVSFAGLFIFVCRREDVIPYVTLYMLSHIGVSIWNMLYAKHRGLKILWRGLNVKPHVKPMMVFFATNVAVSLYTTLGVLLLGFLSDYTQVGYFTSAYKVEQVLLAMVIAVAPVMVVRINVMKSEKNDEKIDMLLSRSFAINLTMTIPMTVGLIVISPRFIPFFFGEPFAPAAVSMRLLASMIFITGLSNFFGNQVLMSLGYDMQRLHAVLWGTIVCIVLNIVLDGRYGALGASIAIVTAQMVVAIAAMIFAFRAASIRVKYQDIVQPLLAAIPVVLLTVFLDKMVSQTWIYLLAAVAAGALLYSGFMLFVFKNVLFRELLVVTLKKIKAYKGYKDAG